MAGTLLGGVLGYLTGTLAERSRRLHEDAHRFEGERRALYVRLLEEADRVEAAIRSRNTAAWAKREHPELAEHMTTPERPDKTLLSRLTEEIELLAPFHVYASASLMKLAIDTLDYASDAPDKEWRDAGSALHKARSTFIKRAKEDLGTPSGVMSRWQERRYRARKRLSVIGQRLRSAANRSGPRSPSD